MAAADTTASPPPGAGGIAVVPVLRVALGALFVSVFFDNLFKGLYSPSGYAALITDFARNRDSTAPGFWRQGVMPFFADNSSLFGPLQALTEASLAIALVVGLVTGLAALAAAGFLTTLWISQLGIVWVWELLGLMIVAAVVALASLPHLRDRARPLRDRILGPRLFQRLGAAGRLLAAAGWGIAFGLVSLATRTGGAAHDGQVAIASGVALAVLLAFAGLLDRGRPVR